MITLSANSANELFATAVRAVLTRGHRSAPRGLATQEVIGVSLQLDDPRRRFICVPPVRLLNAAFAAAETVWILSGSDAQWICDYNSRMAEFADDGVLMGAYGPRIRRWQARVDQLDQVRRLLIADPDTRRAVIQLFDPARDGAGHKDVPCTLGYRFFLRNGRLDMHTTMRSQDLWLGFCYDLFAATVLHELMAGWVDAEIGVYRHQVDSLHLYSEHLPLARELPEAVRPSPVMPPLAAEWSGFDHLLHAVAGDEIPGHAGWAEFGVVMRSYRIWKAGDRADARDLLKRTDSLPLIEGLHRWYDHLDANTAGMRA